MRRWFLMLGGLIVWAVHFMGAYGIASVADVVGRADAPASRLAVGGLSVLCLAANAGLLVWAVRVHAPDQDEAATWTASLGGLAAVFSIIAVAWQGLPTLIGH